MADQIKVTQELTQVEYDNPPKLKTTQEVVQVEYDAPPKLELTQLLVQIEYEQGQETAVPGLFFCHG